jgi:hypothetical protein
MKKLLLVLILIVFGCKDKEPEKVIPKAPVKVVNPYGHADTFLKMESEKLMLLSILKKIPQDTLRLVLREYLKANPEYLDGLGVNKADNLYSISQKYHISKFKIASIIFSYKYEMLTKEEIEESAIENEQVNNQE